ncbi:MAG: RNA pseudouridine synthase [Clostridia bacterium]|nr:RNA pseudouridine synthase [Clostridia bacterium]
MLSQADQTGDTDLLSLLKEDIRVRYQKPGEAWLGLVHRLDRPVGGLMVFARTSKAAARLSQQLREHMLGREYLCVAEGLLREPLTLINYLYKDERLNRVSVVEATRRGAQEAILHGQPLASAEGRTLCAIRLETGRNHQIRVQMAHAGYPLWGDNRYGRGVPGQQIALWGYKLSFEHPTRHEVMTFMSLPRGGIWTGFQPALDGIWEQFSKGSA